MHLPFLCVITLHCCPYAALALSLQIKWSSQPTSWESGCTYHDHAISQYVDTGTAVAAVLYDLTNWLFA